jgi:hypothetical protein
MVLAGVSSVVHRRKLKAGIQERTDGLSKRTCLETGSLRKPSGVEGKKVRSGAAICPIFEEFTSVYGFSFN